MSDKVEPRLHPRWIRPIRTPSDPRHGTICAHVVIADDHPLGRAGHRAMLAGEPGIEIIGEATTGQEAVDLCCALNPDLV